MLKVGNCFESISEFHVELKKYETEQNCVFYKRSTTNIKSARNKGVSRHIRDDLPYQVLYCCIHGGKNKQKTPKDNSRKARTFQRGCPAYIRLIASEDGNSLKIMSIDNNHNHDTTKVKTSKCKCTITLYRVVMAK
ncbi:unnamed protein product [Brassicogethes aeneus]|uniref:ZSWIM3 N-terminal domain-containing protein n=1 Tax=Brassicogethes aeneus TaxID=1431903 RepID=A0A9P0B6U9_BRAAE|nr:unnamed protein product [Brassicogethes aeneus]